MNAPQVKQDPDPKPSPVPAVQFTAVSKWYGPFQALKSIDLTIRAGERVVVCGPSGSGKSTLIRCINRIEAHQAGTLRVNGIEADERSERQIRQRVGMVFQQFNLFPHLTILDNCTLAPRKVLGRPEKDAQESALRYLERVHIADQAHKFPAQLSGGQQQRAAIARCLCMEPQTLLFDEPTSALDPEMIKEVLDVMIGLADEGRTMICVTHEMAFARRVADRIVFMDQGCIIECAAPTEFFASPRSERARQFLAQLIGDH
jgi:general L-amino acid transport system ATP-binding protein